MRALFIGLFRHFEALVHPTGPVPADVPPSTLGGFFWYFVRQMPGLVVRLFVGGVLVAMLDAAIPVCIGRVTGLLSTHAPGTLLRDEWPQFAVMAAILFVARPGAVLLQNLTNNQAIAPGMSNLVRWQSHWHVVRQSWAFFQNDFAGRIAARVMQTGVALREAIVMGADAAWYILAYGVTAGTLLFSLDRWLALPLTCGSPPP